MMATTSSNVDHVLHKLHILGSYYMAHFLKFGYPIELWKVSQQFCNRVSLMFSRARSPLVNRGAGSGPWIGYFLPPAFLYTLLPGWSGSRPCSFHGLSFLAHTVVILIVYLISFLQVKFWDFNSMDSACRAFRTVQPFECHQIRSAQYSITGDCVLVAAGNAQVRLPWPNTLHPSRLTLHRCCFSKPSSLPRPAPCTPHLQVFFFQTSLFCLTSISFANTILYWHVFEP